MGVAGLPLLLSSAIAIELSILSNFALNNGWTFGDRAREVAYTDPSSAIELVHGPAPSCRGPGEPAIR